MMMVKPITVFMFLDFISKNRIHLWYSKRDVIQVQVLLYNKAFNVWMHLNSEIDSFFWEMDEDLVSHMDVM